MKKITVLIASLCAAFGFTACDLEITPDTSITGPAAAQLKYVQGLRAGVYNDMTTITSPAYLMADEYQSDLFVQTDQSGNRGGFYHRWEFYADNQDIRAQWYAHYSVIAGINYTLGKCEETAAKDEAARTELALYAAEMHLFRAYLLNQLALHFCKPYDPATAATLPGVPCPTVYEPGASLGRGTLEETYAAILADIKAAQDGITTGGSTNASYVTEDAVMAFKARVALQMKRYDEAINFASSLYSRYPLVTSKQDLGRMWTADTSTETILQFQLIPTTIALIDSDVADFTYGSWIEAQGKFVYKPSDVPCKWVGALFTPEDWRTGTYVDVCTTETFGNGLLLTKLTGNESLRTTKTVLNYRNKPKMFRIAEMYLIEAEAQYFSSGNAAAPLNKLREKRGLAGVTSTGAALLQDIKDEYVREFMGEGKRMNCLRRWGDGIKRDMPDFVRGHVSPGYNLQVAAGNFRFTWPIPQLEIQNNPAIPVTDQNEGYN